MSIRSEIEDLAREHGDDALGEAISFLPRLIALIKRKRGARITSALDQAHAEIDRREGVLLEQYRARHREDETVPMRPTNAGEGHE